MDSAAASVLVDGNVARFVPLCRSIASKDDKTTPALLQLHVLIDQGHQLYQQWEQEEDEQEESCEFVSPQQELAGDPTLLDYLRSGELGYVASCPRFAYGGPPETKDYNPEYARPAFFHHGLSPFNLDQDSIIQPLRHTAAPAAHLSWSANIHSLKVLRSTVSYPLSLYGCVYVRDDLDRKRVYLFRRHRDDAQTLKSPEDTLALTGPSRGLVISDGLVFEVDLKMRCDDQEVDNDDINFSKGILNYSHACLEWLLALQP